MAQSLRGMHAPQGNNLYLPPNPYLPQNYMAQPQAHIDYPNVQAPPYGAWPQHQLPQQPLQGQQSPMQGHFNPISQQFHPPAMQMPYSVSSHQQLPHITTAGPSTTGNSSRSTYRAGTAGSEGVSSPEQADQGEEPASVTEDKRRRNTVASGTPPVLHCVRIL